MRKVCRMCIDHINIGQLWSKELAQLGSMLQWIVQAIHYQQSTMQHTHTLSLRLLAPHRGVPACCAQ
jgi:hypothetical protein